MFIDEIPPNWLCALFVLLFVIACEAGLIIFNYWFKKRKVPPGNEAAGIVFGTQSLIYSLILAFVIVAVWSDYEELNQTIAEETDKLNSILAHSETLPESIKRPLNSSLSSYCNEIINKEWNTQEDDVDLRPSAIPALRLMLLRLQPKNKLQENIFNVLDEDLSSISDLRRERLSHTHSHVPPLVWLILKAGSVLMVIFSYFLSASSVALQRIYLLFLSSTIAMSLFLVYTLDHPFDGSARVSKKPYENIQVELKKNWVYPID